MSYAYWNQFIDTWRRLPVQPFNIYTTHNNYAPANITSWTNPNLLPLFNSNLRNSYSLEYLPETWWGNAGSTPLNSVVINYNPGWAEDYKHYSDPAVIALFNNPSYSQFAASQANLNPNIFTRTNRWHFYQRAKKIFDTLLRTGVNINGNNNLENHLSIELIPWHTQDISNIEYYISNNLQNVFLYGLKFAADESRRIDNNLLKNIVIIRCGGSATKKLIDNISAQGISNYTIISDIGYALPGPPVTPNGKSVTGNGGYLKFSLDQIPGICFISIWGKKSRNAFPPPGDMDWIFQNII